MLLGVWVVTLFGLAISGAHFNPAVTLVFMFAKKSNFGSRRLLGIIYIAGQFLGGIAAAFVSKFLNDSNEFHNVQATPIEDKDGDSKIFSSVISELVGSFVFIFMFMLCTDKKTQFSKDKVINCFIIASAYVSSRLMAGGGLVTGHEGSRGEGQKRYLRTGPVLNPALAFGQMVATFEFMNVQYILCPLAGSALALIFYEFIFVKS